MKSHKTIYENYLQRIALMDPTKTLNPLTKFPDFKKVLGPMTIDNEVLQQVFKSMEKHYLNDFKNYLIADKFYSVIEKAAGKINIDNIPSSECFNENENTYQLSLPLMGHDYIIDFRGEKNRFNITIFRFLREPVVGQDDFDFWRLVGGENISCREMLDDFFVSSTHMGGDRDRVMTVLKNEFSLIINLVLYINSGEPDLRKLKGHNGKGIKFGGKNRISKIRRYSQTSFTDATIVGFSYKKITEVDPYVKWQHYGPMSTLRRLQIISGYEKKGKDYEGEK